MLRAEIILQKGKFLCCGKDVSNELCASADGESKEMTQMNSMRVWVFWHGL